MSICSLFKLPSFPNTLLPGAKLFDPLVWFPGKLRSKLLPKHTQRPRSSLGHVWPHLQFALSCHTLRCVKPSNSSQGEGHTNNRARKTKGKDFYFLKKTWSPPSGEAFPLSRALFFASFSFHGKTVFWGRSFYRPTWSWSALCCFSNQQVSQENAIERKTWLQMGFCLLLGVVFRAAFFFFFALFLQMNLLKLAGLGKIEADATKNSERTQWSEDIAMS